MLSFLSSMPADVLSFMGAHLGFFVGYGFCVLFPLPWLNSWILSLWKDLLTSKVITEVTNPTPTPAPAPVVTPPTPPAA